MCDECGKGLAGWPYLAAELVGIASFVSVAVLAYEYAVTWDMVKDAQDSVPLAARISIALLSVFVGLLVGLAAYGAGRIAIVLCREMRTVRTACRLALCGGGRGCRWCGRSWGAGAPTEAVRP